MFESYTGEPGTSDSDWETQSEEDVFHQCTTHSKPTNCLTTNRPADPELTLECPVVKEDVSKLTEIPVSTLASARSMSWLRPVLTYKHENKAYERIMVRIL